MIALSNTVIPVLVTGIHRASGSAACGWLDPGHEARDDNSRETPMHFALTEGQTGPIQETALTFAEGRITQTQTIGTRRATLPIDVVPETTALGMASV